MTRRNSSGGSGNGIVGDTNARPGRERVRERRKNRRHLRGKKVRASRRKQARQGKHLKGVRARGGNVVVDLVMGGFRYRETLRMAPTPENLRAAAEKRELALREYAMGQAVEDILYRHFPDSKVARLQRSAVHVRYNATIGEALDEYEAGYLNDLSPGSLPSYKQICTLIRGRWGSTPVHEFTGTELSKWLNARRVSASRFNNVLIVARKLVTICKEKKWVQGEPLAGLKNKKRHMGEPDPFTLDEWWTIEGFFPEEVRNMLTVAAFTGMRPSEYMWLRKSDVDLDGGKVYVREFTHDGALHTLKTPAAHRTIFLLKPAKRALARQLALNLPGEFVFPDPATGTPWDIRKVRRRWQKVLKAAGVRYRVLYNTRHTYASMMLSAGESPYYVAVQLGHKDTSLIEKRYARWIEDIAKMAGAGESIGKVLDSDPSRHQAGTKGGGNKGGKGKSPRKPKKS